MAEVRKQSAERCRAANERRRLSLVLPAFDSAANTPKTANYNQLSLLIYSSDKRTNIITGQTKKQNAPCDYND